MRDYLEEIRWNKQPPVPSLPDDVVLRTRDKYLEAFRRLTGTGARHAMTAMLREQLERLVDEMVTKGVRYEDAQREFEKKFIAHVLLKADGNLWQGRRPARHAPQHAEPQDDRIPPAPTLARAGDRP